MPALTAKDHADMRLGAELGFDYVALSFVRGRGDVEACKAALQRLGVRVPVIAKLEKVEAIKQLKDILGCADVVMVARGDLGVEMSLGEVPAVQKDIIYRANRAGVPVITATEMKQSNAVTDMRTTNFAAILCPF